MSASARRKTLFLTAVALSACGGNTPAATPPWTPTIHVAAPSAPPAEAANPETAARPQEAEPLVAKANGRCEVSRYWISPEGDEVVACVAGIALRFYDPETGTLTKGSSLESPIDEDAREAIARFFTFEPLRRYSTRDDEKHPKAGALAVPPKEASGEGLVVRYVEPTVTLLDRKGRVLLRRSFPAWNDDDFDFDDDGGCHFPEKLDGILFDLWGDRERGVFVLDLIGTSGFESCNHKEHLIRLPVFTL